MKYIIIGLLWIMGVSKSFGQQNWKLAKNDKGIQVYVSEVPGSKYFAFKAIMSVKTKENEIVRIIKDINKYPEWFAYTESAVLIKKSENELYFTMETDYPWPFSNECMNYSMAFQKIENKNIKINITGTSDKVACKYSLKKASGYILLEPQDEDIKITYYFHSESSQNIPAQLINPMIHKMPFQTFIALKKRLSQ